MSSNIIPDIDSINDRFFFYPEYFDEDPYLKFGKGFNFLSVCEEAIIGKSPMIDRGASVRQIAVWYKGRIIEDLVNGANGTFFKDFLPGIANIEFIESTVELIFDCFKTPFPKIENKHHTVFVPVHLSGYIQLDNGLLSISAVAILDKIRAEFNGIEIPKADYRLDSIVDTVKDMNIGGYRLNINLKDNYDSTNDSTKR